MGAACCKGAAVQGACQVRRLAFNGEELFSLGLQRGDRSLQGLVVGVAGLGKDGIGGTGFDDLPGIHDIDAVTKASHHSEIMGNKDDGHVELLLHLLDEFQNLSLNRDIQSRGWLIGNQ